MRVWAVKGMSSAPGRGSAGAPWWASTSATIERPSGVSSARLDWTAASARSRIGTLGIGMSSVAWRLPKVIVPVLSSSSVEQSPAASTARPDIASTLRCTRRFMPAIPIADNSAPMVVGIRQTKSATSTMIDCAAPEYIAKGCSETIAITNTSVSPASRMSRAISLGVLWRLAPSTSEIMRSRKVCAGIGGDPHQDAVRQDPGAAGDRRAVPAGLADHGRRLAGDRRFVDRRDALDDLAVAGNDVARDDLADIAGAQVGRGDLSDRPVLDHLGDRVRAGAAQGVGLRLAAAFGDRLGEVGEQDRERQPRDDPVRRTRSSRASSFRSP